MITLDQSEARIALHTGRSHSETQSAQQVVTVVHLSSGAKTGRLANCQINIGGDKYKPLFTRLRRPCKWVGKSNKFNLMAIYIYTYSIKQYFILKHFHMYFLRIQRAPSRCVSFKNHRHTIDTPDISRNQFGFCKWWCCMTKIMMAWCLLVGGAGSPKKERKNVILFKVIQNNNNKISIMRLECIAPARNE